MARTYLINERPDAIINIVNGTNIERNLYLSTQIMELGIPVVLAVNMVDVVEKSGDKIDTDKLSRKLGCQVVKISALKGVGIQEAADKAVELARKKAVAAVFGLIAKENVVATFGMLFGYGEVAENGQEIWGNLALIMTPLAVYGYLVFNLLCAPCFAAMGAIKREMNNAKWFWAAISYQTVLAYIVSMCIYQIGTLITAGTFSIVTVVAILLVIRFIWLLFRPYRTVKELRTDSGRKLAKAS